MWVVASWFTGAVMPPRETFLMSPPRLDWRLIGRSNVFSQAHTASVRPGAALREWLALADAIAATPADIVLVPSSDDSTLTGLPYTAEAGLLASAAGEPVFLLPNVKPSHRRGEAALLAGWAAASGLCTAAVPVLWEGAGDVLEVRATGSTRRFVCTSGEGAHARTSAAAFDHVSPFLPGPAIHVRFRAEPWFHGNTFLGFFRGEQETLALVCEDALLPGEKERLRTFLPDVRFAFLTQAESLLYATNALQVGRRVLAPRGLPAWIGESWRTLGLDVSEIELPTLFGRGGGAAVCMTNRLELSAERVPRQHHYAHARPKLVALLDGGGA